MSDYAQQPTRGQSIGGAIFGLSIVFCSMEMVPGWGIFHLNWPPGAFYLIMLICGGVSGLFFAAEYPLPGLIAGAISGLGALYAIALVLENVDSVYDVFLVIAGLVGALPGVGVYFALKLAQDAIAPRE
jgi:hypothetical protein